MLNKISNISSEIIQYKLNWLYYELKISNDPIIYLKRWILYDIIDNSHQHKLVYILFVHFLEKYKLYQQIEYTKTNINKIRDMINKYANMITFQSQNSIASTVYKNGISFNDVKTILKTILPNQKFTYGESNFERMYCYIFFIQNEPKKPFL